MTLLWLTEEHGVTLKASLLYEENVLFCFFFFVLFCFIFYFWGFPPPPYVSVLFAGENYNGIEAVFSDMKKTSDVILKWPSEEKEGDLLELGGIGVVLTRNVFIICKKFCEIYAYIVLKVLLRDIG